MSGTIGYDELRAATVRQVAQLMAAAAIIAFMKHPAQFIQLQQSLANDALNEYIHHTGSAVFAVPPGVRPGQHWGDTLFT